MRTFLRAVLVIVVLITASARAAVINWGTETDIAGDSDVSTTGALVGAFNVGGNATTINGVNFQAFPITTQSNTVGDFNLAWTTGIFGVNNVSTPQPPFSNLSPAYQTMLSTQGWALGTITLTMSNLIVGQQYQFQVWANDSRNHTPPGFAFPVEVSAGNSVTLDPNPSALEGGVGQYVIGTFTADATTQQITFDDAEVGGSLNGFQLRAINNVNPGPSVPLPPAIWVGLVLGAVALGRKL